VNRVHLKTYGCQMNARDSEAVAAMLRNRGYAIVDDEADADIVLLNTCSVRDLAEQKALGKARNLLGRKRRDPRFLVGILGCMAQNRGAELLDQLPDLDLVVGTQKFHRVPDHLDHLITQLTARGPRPSSLLDLDPEEGSQNTIRDHFSAPATSAGAPSEAGPSGLPSVASAKEGTAVGAPQISAFVSIMQGCNMNCAFCIVPKTRGPERSRPLDDIVREVEQLLDHGTREVTLLGQIVTSYGRREFPAVDGQSPFVQLLERLHALPRLARIRFTSPHPAGFKSDLIAAFRDLPKLGHYIHLPVQSGSNAILRAMNRPYTRESYLRLIDQLRAAQPHLWFSTDIIVGFPGETAADFALTRDLFTTVGFEMAYIFKYSTRSGTPAATMPDQIPDDVKESRNQELLALLEQRSLARHQSLLGTTQEVLVEGPAKRGLNRLMGRNPAYRKVIFTALPTQPETRNSKLETSSHPLLGQLVPIRITSATVSTLEGEIVTAESVLPPVNFTAL
jgi:tRNA-2-methylthio-N6-dimethylallyladenosine synthase